MSFFKDNKTFYMFGTTMLLGLYCLFFCGDPNVWKFKYALYVVQTRSWRPVYVSGTTSSFRPFEHGHSQMYGVIGFPIQG